MLMKLTAPLTITYLVTLMANINDGTNRLIINDTVIPSSSWVGTGTYTYTNGTRSITIDKIAEDTGNIMIEEITGSHYKLVAKNTDTTIYADNVVFDGTSVGSSADDVEEALIELYEDTATLSNRLNTGAIRGGYTYTQSIDSGSKYLLIVTSSNSNCMGLYLLNTTTAGVITRKDVVEMVYITIDTSTANTVVLTSSASVYSYASFIKLYP